LCLFKLHLLSFNKLIESVLRSLFSTLTGVENVIATKKQLSTG